MIVCIPGPRATFPVTYVLNFHESCNYFTLSSLALLHSIVLGDLVILDHPICTVVDVIPSELSVLCCTMDGNILATRVLSLHVRCTVCFKV